MLDFGDARCERFFLSVCFCSFLVTCELVNCELVKGCVRKCVNTRGYHSEYGYSWFNNRENDDAYYMFRSYNNCYYSSSDYVSDEEDEL